MFNAESWRMNLKLEGFSNQDRRCYNFGCEDLKCYWFFVSRFTYYLLLTFDFDLNRYAVMPLCHYAVMPLHLIKYFTIFKR